MAIDCTNRQVTRTMGTTIAYHESLDQLRWMAERETCAVNGLSDIIGWFVAQHARWSESTVRQYRATLNLAVQETELHPAVRDNLRQRLHGGPLARVGGPRRTSARKRKSVSPTEMMMLIETLAKSKSPDGRLLANYLIFATALFLRPVEFVTASVSGTEVTNAKATNGRGNGPVRERDISPMGKSQIDQFALFLGAFRDAAASAGSWKRLNDRLASRLARTCKAIGIPRVSLYTIRHVGMATAKTWMAPEEVAAAAGHGHVRTAMMHYAKARTGWRGMKFAGLPAPASVAAVRGSARTYATRKLPAPSP